MMHIQHASSTTGTGSQAAARVASSLAPRTISGAKTTGTGSAKDTSGSSNAAADPSDITSSDFLTLLVSELQNQDPTQPTDPNAYISQLVDVNSLQQLIQINEGLSTAEGGGASSQSGSANEIAGARDVASVQNGRGHAVHKSQSDAV